MRPVEVVHGAQERQSGLLEPSLHAPAEPGLEFAPGQPGKQFGVWDAIPGGGRNGGDEVFGEEAEAEFPEQRLELLVSRGFGGLFHGSIPCE